MMARRAKVIVQLYMKVFNGEEYKIRILKILTWLHSGSWSYLYLQYPVIQKNGELGYISETKPVWRYEKYKIIFSRSN